MRTHNYLLDLSHASATFRGTSSDSEDRAAQATSIYSSSSLGAEMDVEISPELLEAFCSSLRSLNIDLRFFTGSWESLLQNKTSILHIKPRPYDVVLTSETIYRQASLKSLIGVLSSAVGSPPFTDDARLDKGADDEGNGPWCLVAAKVMYFGVGGGVNEFLRAVEGKGQVETVWEQKGGVGRVIMRVRWDS